MSSRQAAKSRYKMKSKELVIYPLCSLLFLLYRFKRLRSLSYRLVKKLEGGAVFSSTARRILEKYHGVEVGAYSYGECMKPGSFPKGVKVGRFVSVATDVRIFLRNHPLDQISTHPFFFNRHLGFVHEDTVSNSTLEIADDAWVGNRAIITQGCSRIGLGAVVGAGSVVTKDVPDFAIVAGNPARLIRFRFDEAIQDLIRSSRWWENSIEDCAEHLGDMLSPVTADFAGFRKSHPPISRQDRSALKQRSTVYPVLGSRTTGFAYLSSVLSNIFAMFVDR